MSFHSPSGYPTRDWMQEEAAHDLAARVRGYWAARGYVVDVSIVPMGNPKAEAGKDRVVWGVRSDMVNGQPQRRAIQ